MNDRNINWEFRNHREKMLSFRNELKHVQDTFEEGIRLYELDDFEAAFEMLQKAALDDHPLAEYMVGMMHLYGTGTAEDIDKAILWLRKAFEDHVPASATALGLLYMRGYHVSRDETIGAELLELGARMGDPEGQYYYHVVLKSKGKDVEALEFLKKASDAGFPAAMDALGWTLVNGDLPDSDRDAGVELLRRAVNEGDSTAMADLALVLIEEGGHDDEVMHLCQKSAAEGNRQGMLLLGNVLMKGICCRPNPEVGIRWLQRAADMGSETAARILEKTAGMNTVRQDKNLEQTMDTKNEENSAASGISDAYEKIEGEMDILNDEFREVHLP